MKLREIREANGLTQTEISRMTGLNQATICRMESGELNPTLTTLKTISAALDCTVGQLLGDAPYKHTRRRAGRPS